jgi:N-acetylmuramoyl-L-alanine amidase
MSIRAVGSIVIAGVVAGCVCGCVVPAAAQEADFPLASGIRLAGDEAHTRMVIDFDQKIDARVFTMANPDRVVVDLPQVAFSFPPRTGEAGRGLVKGFRYGLVTGGSRIVIDLARPARVEKSYALDAVNDQPARLVLDLASIDHDTFMRNAALDNRLRADASTARPEAKPDQKKSGPSKVGQAKPDQTKPDQVAAAPTQAGPTPARQAEMKPDSRPIIMLDPGHGGIDNGTKAPSGELEKSIVLDFALLLRDKIEKAGKFHAVMTRSDDTFIALADRVQFARNQQASLFVSIHADALPRGEGDAQGATIYTLSDTASDAEAARLAETENRADVIAGVDLTSQPDDVADILIDLAQRETKAFSVRFARDLVDSMRTATRMHKNPLKSAGFRVLKAPDIPSVLVELGYVSNRQDLKSLVSADWRDHSTDAVVRAIDQFFAPRLAGGGGRK